MTSGIRLQALDALPARRLRQAHPLADRRDRQGRVRLKQSQDLQVDRVHDVSCSVARRGGLASGIENDLLRMQGEPRSKRASGR
jgi:hypothetical protein